MSTTTIEVLAEVQRERLRQEELRRAGKFLWTCADPDQPSARKLAVLAEEFGEAAREVTEEMIASDKDWSITGLVRSALTADERAEANRQVAKVGEADVKRAIVWTEAHRREAKARSLELRVDMIRDGDTSIGGGAMPFSEQQYRAWLQAVPQHDSARIDREVRRVDGLATGRMVREAGWRIVSEEGAVSVFSHRRPDPRDVLTHERIVRVVRICRRPT